MPLRAHSDKARDKRPRPCASQFPAMPIAQLQAVAGQAAGKAADFFVRTRIKNIQIDNKYKHNTATTRRHIKARQTPKHDDSKSINTMNSPG